MEILFVAGVAVITADLEASRSLYREALGLPVEGDDYPASDQIPGLRHFGVWPLSAAAQACFGTPDWPTDRPAPQATVEFELASPEAVDAGAAELEEAGYQLVHGAKTEPWGQTVARVQSPEGILVGLSYAPWMHDA